MIIGRVLNRKRTARTSVADRLFQNTGVALQQRRAARVQEGRIGLCGLAYRLVGAGGEWCVQRQVRIDTPACIPGYEGGVVILPTLNQQKPTTISTHLLTAAGHKPGYRRSAHCAAQPLAECVCGTCDRQHTAGLFGSCHCIEQTSPKTDTDQLLQLLS